MCKSRTFKMLSIKDIIMVFIDNSQLLKDKLYENFDKIHQKNILQY